MSDWINKMMADIPRKTVDQNSMTPSEIAKVIPCNESTARKIAKDHVKSGKWEQVFKQVDNRLRLSYRKKK